MYYTTAADGFSRELFDPITLFSVCVCVCCPCGTFMSLAPLYILSFPPSSAQQLRLLEDHLRVAQHSLAESHQKRKTLTSEVVVNPNRILYTTTPFQAEPSLHVGVFIDHRTLS